MSTLPLWTLARVVREVVEPSAFAAPVLHYSIPALASTGRPTLEDPSEIMSAKLLLRGDEILVSRLNPRKGMVVAVEPADEVMLASTEFVPLRPDRGVVDPRFLRYSLVSEDVRQRLDAAVQSVTRSHQRVEPTVLTHLNLNVPPLHDQCRIADFLDSQIGLIGRAIALRAEQQSLAQEQQRAAVLRAVTGQDQGAGVRSSGLMWAETVASEWPVTKIVHHARLGSGHTPSRSNPAWWVDCPVPWITTGEVAQIRDDRQEVLLETRERLSYLGIANSSAEIHPKGTVVLSRTASAGFSAVMGTAMATSQDFVTWTCGKTLDPFFLLWCLRAMRPDLLGRLAMGSTHKTIYVPDVQGIRIPVPPVEVQHQVVQRVREIRSRFDDVADLQARQVALLQERKQSLITAAVSGQFDVSTASARSVA